MQESWRPVEVILAEDLSHERVVEEINAQIRINAAEAGDFVARVRVGFGQPHSPGLLRWDSAYLAGPPGSFPAGRPERVQ
ncbi:hypothetical protein [Mycolicibacter senuensis]|uniref:Uncharacterized protein n=1 Tax=Mycolicibacter senuensis TaxID=386913 RepID=A0A7I9XI93_9MYCO|nr:hypothetical protein [Mycolicibacter senuensis]ORW70710.1 hypothetical protein AWC24_03435 [Mycolicibacter senuensis]GFG69699.1 hypothetical protein MSEN_14190 [Mycolicibacter senuensis]